MTTDSNVTPMPTRLEQLGKRFEQAWKRTCAGQNEWIEGSLEMMQILAEARGLFPSNNDFSEWVKENNHDHLNKNDRAALISLASDLTLSRKILTETDRRSYKYIWEEHKSRFPYVGKTTARKNNTVARVNHSTGLFEHTSKDEQKSDTNKREAKKTKSSEIKRSFINPPHLGASFLDHTKEDLQGLNPDQKVHLASFKVQQVRDAGSLATSVLTVIIACTNQPNAEEIFAAIDKMLTFKGTQNYDKRASQILNQLHTILPEALKWLSDISTKLEQRND